MKNLELIKREAAPPFTTVDGSTIRELLAYRNSSLRNQSLAEATVPVGGATTEHYHPQTEEIYYILSGIGRMQVDGVMGEVVPGDAIPIPPGQRHKIWNTGADALVFLCMCAPCYEHADTVLTE